MSAQDNYNQIAPGHNPNGLTVYQVGLNHRLLLENEVGISVSVPMLQEIESWAEKIWRSNGFWGNSRIGTFRVHKSITPEKLREMRGLKPAVPQQYPIPTNPNGTVKWVNSGPAITPEDLERVTDKNYVPKRGDFSLNIKTGEMYYILDTWDVNVGWYEDPGVINTIIHIYRRKAKRIDLVSINDSDRLHMVADGGFFYKKLNVIFRVTSSLIIYNIEVSRDPINGPWYPVNAVPVNLLPWRK